MRTVTNEERRDAGDQSNPERVGAWNVLATAKNLEQRHLARRLKRFGDFRWAPYLGLLIGRVQDHQAFFDQLLRCEENEPGFLFPLARLVPLNQTFIFTTDTLVSMLKSEVLGYADQIGSGSFYVRVERRGHKDEIHSRQIEQALADALIESLSKRGHTPHVEYHDPDAIIAIEIVGNECGVGLITKSLRERYPFVKVS